MIDWMLEHWFVEAICIIVGSSIVGLIVGRVLGWLNGEDQWRN